jgi:hypothetical protein
VNPAVKVTEDAFPVSLTTETLENKIKALVQEKETLEKRVSECQDEKKNLISSLETEKEMHKKTNDKLTLSEKNIRQEKNETERLIRHWKD